MAQILPSIFGTDILRLRDEIEFLECENTAILYADMMDDNFVSNITFGPNQVGITKKASKMMSDVHMVIDHPKDHLDDVIVMGVKMISIHYESTPRIHNMIQRIKEAGGKAGIVLNPGIPESMLEYLLDNIDYVLITTINPGTLGQTFIEKSLEKIANLEKMIGSYPIQTEVDGGVNDVIVKQVVSTGAELTAVGGYLFGDNPDERYSILREVVKQKLRWGYGTISMISQGQRG